VVQQADIRADMTMPKTLFAVILIKHLKLNYYITENIYLHCKDQMVYVFREVITVYFGNYRKYLNILCKQIAVFEF